MSYRLLMLIFFSVLCIQLNAQPAPCVEPVQMTSFCEDACIICDIDGFTGRHDSDIEGEAPSDFCTFVVHNAQWIAFQAGSTDLTIQLSVNNCQLGNGLEMAIYESLDCENYTLVSNCRGGSNPVPENSSAQFTNISPLTIGQYYYLVMDGNFGDNCDWTFQVLNGSTEVSPLNTSGNINGPAEICTELLTSYSVQAEEGAVFFDWTINGEAFSAESEATSIETTFPSTGFYEICVTASNACDEASPTCFTTNVKPIPVTIINDSFCEGECYEILDSLLCDSGNYSFQLLQDNGCDSIVEVQLEMIPINEVFLDVLICEEDTLYIGNTPFYEDGMYTELLQTAEECDSIVHLNLSTIVCTIFGENTSTPTICFNESSGEIDFQITIGTAPFTYSWELLGESFSGNGTITSLNEMINISDLPNGTYMISIEDDFDNIGVMIVEVQEPLLLSLVLEAEDYSGYNVSCFGTNDGALTAFPTGGSPTYTYNWSTNENNSSIQNLAASTYTLTITDALGCSTSASYTLTEPSELSLNPIAINPNCDGLETGMIDLSQSNGGIAPYSFSVNGNTFSDSIFYNNLGPNNYTILLKDNNECTTQTTVILSAPLIPEVILMDDVTIGLGCPIEISAITNNVPLQSIQWTPYENLDLSDSLQVIATPFISSNYSLEVVSIDDCSAVDSVNIQVEAFRQFYAPNTFSPNGDGINDVFTLYGSKEVKAIQSLKIFDRWGNFIFETINSDPNDPLTGWDGFYKGKLAEEGIYVWVAEILFLDDVIEVHASDIALIR